MKNTILLLAALIISVTSFAQKITYGVTAGVTSYNIGGAATGNLQQLLSFTGDMVKTQPLTAFYAGGYSNIPLTNKISFEPGINYTAKGMQIKGTYAVKDFELLNALATAGLHLSYIDMPLVLKANFNGLQIFAGPQVSYLTSANLKTKVSVAGFGLLNSSSDVSDRFNRWDAGLTAGVGYQFSNGLRLSAAYDHGLINVDAGRQVSSFNRGFKIGVGFSF